MKKITMLFLLTLGFVSCVFALEIKSVIRDFEYRDIFTYKHDLIGDAQANKFQFEPPDTSKPEYFLIKLKSFSSEEGEKVKIIFQYKTHLSKELKEISQEMVLMHPTEKLYFRFSNAQNLTDGRVEIWRVTVLKKNKVIAEKKSPDFQWR
jgi:hypothetical protein